MTAGDWPLGAGDSRPTMTAPQRIQMRRAKGWRKPEGVIYVGRPGPYGNPFRDSSWLMWMSIALGLRADRPGRHRAAVLLHRSWLTGQPVRLREYDAISNAEYDGGSIEFGDGSTLSMGDHVAGIAAFSASLYEAPVLPERPDLAPLRDRDLACWCHADQPCHADTLIDLANPR